MSSRVKELQDHTKQSIFHHGLIKLIIITELQKRGKTWDYFLFWFGFQSEKEDQSKRRQVNKPQNLVKKLKKEVIVKVEEENVQERSMTQRVENPKIEQQNKANEDEKKVDEDELLTVQSQDLDHAENTLNKDANQGVDEGLVEQEQIHTEVHSERKEIPLIDKARVDNAHSSQEEFEEKMGFTRS